METVVDSVTGEAPPRGAIRFGAAYGLSRCSPLNSAGEYSVDRLPLTTYVVGSSCFGAKLLGTSITVATAAPLATFEADG